MNEEARELLKKAIFTLVEEYDVDKDAFFLVYTQNGKTASAEGAQEIIGELNLKSLVTFFVHSINHLCLSLDMNPHVFISSFITDAFLQEFPPDSVMDIAFEGDPMFVEPEEEEEEPTIYVPNLDWDTIKN